MEPNRFRYLVSLASELKSQSDRVRNLIGDAHWLSDGHHKEYLLVGLLRRHLPSGVIASRGFVVGTQTQEVSSEQDILIVDTTAESPVFFQGDVIVAFPTAVLAAISVKTKLDSGTVEDSVKGLKTVRDVAVDESDANHIWCGGYFYDVSEAVRKNPATVFSYMKEAMETHQPRRPLIGEPGYPCGPDFIASAEDLAFKVDHGFRPSADAEPTSRIRGFACGGIATAAFLGALLDHVAEGRKRAISGLSALVDSAYVHPIAGTCTIDFKSAKT